MIGYTGKSLRQDAWFKPARWRMEVLTRFDSNRPSVADGSYNSVYTGEPGRISAISAEARSAPRSIRR